MLQTQSRLDVPAVIGFLEVVNESGFYGWAYAANASDMPLELTLHIDGIFEHSFKCHDFRKDVIDAGHPRAEVGFHVPAPPEFCDGQSHDFWFSVHNKIIILKSLTGKSLEKHRFCFPDHFDPHFYTTFYDDVRNLTALEAYIHWSVTVRAEARYPNSTSLFKEMAKRGATLPSDFSPHLYRLLNRDIDEDVALDWQAALHYLHKGLEQGRPHTLKIQSQRPEGSNEWLSNGWSTLIATEFDATYYLASYPDVATAGVDPLQHFLQYGQSELRSPCGWFAPEFYIKIEPISASHEGGPFAHYLQIGRKSGLIPSSEFLDYQNPRIAKFVKWLFSRRIERDFYESLLGSNKEENIPLLEFLYRDRSLLVAPPVSDLAGKTANYFNVPKGWHLFHWYIVTRMFEVNQQDLFREFCGIMNCELPEFSVIKGHVREDFYLAFNHLRESDVPSAFEHYIKGGWLDDMDPNPLFSTAYYLREHRDVARVGLNPLLHFHAHGMPEGRTAYPLIPRKADLSDIGLLEMFLTNLNDRHANPVSNSLEHRPDVVIVVPIHKALAEVTELLHTFDNTISSQQRVLLVDDFSNDPQLTLLLQSWARTRSGAEVIPLEYNRGFAGACNVAFQKCQKNHVVIVNSDTKPPAGWLSRLMAPIDRDPTVGSVTPFSNTTSVTGFPDRQYEGGTYLNLPNEKVDEVISALPPNPIDLVTGVGFFLAMNGAALRVVAGFDAEVFKSGYFEDTDWCQRASTAGFRNVLAPNLFVYHKPGSSSYSTKERKRLSDLNRVPFTLRHPGFRDKIRQEGVQDPALPFRMAAKIGCWISSAQGIIAIIEHGWGGGANDVVNATVQDLLHNGACVMRIVGQYDRFSIKFSFRIEEETYLDVSSDVLIVMLRTIRPSSVEVHASHSLADPPSTIEIILSALGRSATVRFFVHDYFIICPSPHLLDWTGSYCGVPDLPTCAKCLSRNGNAKAYAASVSSWRTAWLRALRRVDEVIVFDRSGVDILHHAFPGSALPPIAIRPHQTDDFSSDLVNATCGRPFRKIAFCGIIGRHKGSVQIRSLINWTALWRPGLEFTLFGEWADGPVPTGLLDAGRYNPGDLARLLNEREIDLVVFASICPETFSFTLSEIFGSGVPCLGFDLGAQATRLRAYPRGVVVNSSQPHDIIAAAESLIGQVER